MSELLTATVSSGPGVTMLSAQVSNNVLALACLVGFFVFLIVTWILCGGHH